ncbi:hypothetical protein [Actinomadura sp. SCN-SB]|uniref:hypothetical protein n=1 Tax=Actinomadura sp. SCN-SB TaxID=3373092 RepID=UPI003752B7E2
MSGEVSNEIANGMAGKTPRTEGRGEMFVFLGWAWDVDAATRLAARHPVVWRDVARMGWARHVVHIDRDHAARVTLSRPLIAVPVPKAEVPLVIDGYHRIHRAITLKIPRLPVIVLDAADERACRIMGGGVTPPG